MANNRIYLVCRGCGSRFSPMKYYPSQGWYFSKTDHQLDAWTADHTGHDPRKPARDHSTQKAIFDGAFFTVELEDAGL